MATTELTTSLLGRAARENAPAAPHRVAAPAKSADSASPEAATAAAEREAEAAAKEPAREQQAPADVQESVNKLNDLMQSVRRELHFSVDDQSGRTVIKVVDAETQEIVRQIPPEEVVTLAEQMAGGETPSLLGSMTA